MEEWKQAIDKLSSWGVVYFNISGGEPLLRSDIEGLVRYIASEDHIAAITSNGTLLTEQKVDRLARSGLSILTLSVDSYKDFGKHEFNKTARILERAGSKGVIPVIHCVITSTNANAVPDLAEKTVQRGIFFSCSLYQAIGGIQSRQVDHLVPDVHDVKQVFHHLKRLKRRTGMVKTTLAYMNSFERYFPHRWHCNPISANWVAVHSDGTLLACCEWSTGISVFDIKSVLDSEWDHARKQVMERCPGCYYECYFSEHEVYRADRLLHEIPVTPYFWRKLLRLLWGYLLSPPAQE